MDGGREEAGSGGRNVLEASSALRRVAREASSCERSESTGARMSDPGWAGASACLCSSILA